MKITILIFLLTAGCIVTHRHNTRFTADYTKFHQLPNDPTTRIYFDETLKVSDYDRFLIEPFQIYPNPHSKPSRADRKTLNSAADKFRRRAVEALSGDFALAEKPGPGVLILEFSLMDIKPSMWVTDETGRDALIANTIKEGSKFQLDCFDGKSRDRVMTISTTYAGEEYEAFVDPTLMLFIEYAYNDWLDKLVVILKE